MNSLRFLIWDCPASKTGIIHRLIQSLSQHQADFYSSQEAIDPALISLQSIGVFFVGTSENPKKLIENLCQTLPNMRLVVIKKNPSLADAVEVMRLGADDICGDLDEDIQSSIQAALSRLQDEGPPSADLAHIDDVTGLYNHRFLGTVLDQLIENHKTQPTPFAVLFLDIDFFKSINDQYGHAIGTQVLIELANYLKKCVREYDLVFRYGGDEFIILCKSCDAPTAKRIAGRIRASIEKKSFSINPSQSEDSQGGAIHLTVSIGIALYPDHATSRSEILAQADSAMFDAKRTTRNSVSFLA